MTTTTIGTSSDDKLVGGSGTDILSAGAGDDFINGGSGSDTVDGGSGIDTVLGGSGSDTLIYRAWENQYVSGATYFSGDETISGFSGYDQYNGGSGTAKLSTGEVDTLVIYLSQQQMADTVFMIDFQDELAAYREFIASQANINTGQAGPASFTFTTINLTASAIEKVTYALDPTSPVAKNDTAFAVEAGGVANGTPGQAAEGNVILGSSGTTEDDDSDPNGSVLDLKISAVRTGEEAAPDGSRAGTVGIALKGLYGWLTLNEDGSYTYVIDENNMDALAAGESVSEIFTYTLKDASGLTDTAELKIEVRGTNDAPVAVADTARGGENQTLSIDVLANDTDVDDGHVFTLVSALAPTGQGTASVVDGKVAFDPGTAFDGLAVGQSAEVVIAYTMTDEHGAESSSTVTVTVTGTNDAPVAVADTARGGENQTLSIDVLANDTDVDDGHVFTLVSALAPTGQGTASVVDGKVAFDPGTAFDGLAVGQSAEVVIAYTMTDEHGAESSSTVTVTVTGTNDAPVAEVPTTNQGPIVISKNTTATFSTAQLLLHDTDTGNNGLTVTSATFYTQTGTPTVLSVSGGTVSFGSQQLGGDDKGYVSFTLSDGQVLTSEIRVVNADPGGDFDASSGSLSDPTLDGYWGSYLDARGGNDTLAGTTYVGAANTFTGSGGHDVFFGGDGDDKLLGRSGDDRLYGGVNNDTLDGGDGADRLQGDGGRDVLTGGAGSDTFVFVATSDSGTVDNKGNVERDLIQDFLEGNDRIDLTAIDADTTTFGEDSFVLATSGLIGAGQLRVSYDSANNVTIVHGYVNADTTSDFSVALSGNISLGSGDFLL